MNETVIIKIIFNPLNLIPELLFLLFLMKGLISGVFFPHYQLQ